MLTKETAQEVLTMVDDITTAMRKLNAYWHQVDSAENSDDLQNLLQEHYPFEMDFNEVTEQYRSWVDNISDEVHKLAKCTELVDCTGKKIWVNNSELPFIVTCIKEKMTAMEIKDRDGVHRIIVFACNPILFVQASLAV